MGNDAESIRRKYDPFGEDSNPAYVANLEAARVIIDDTLAFGTDPTYALKLLRDEQGDTLTQIMLTKYLGTPTQAAEEVGVLPSFDDRLLHGIANVTAEGLKHHMEVQLEGHIAAKLLGKE